MHHDAVARLKHDICGGISNEYLLQISAENLKCAVRQRAKDLRCAHERVRRGSARDVQRIAQMYFARSAVRARPAHLAPHRNRRHALEIVFAENPNRVHRFENRRRGAIRQNVAETEALDAWPVIGRVQVDDLCIFLGRFRHEVGIGCHNV